MRKIKVWDKVEKIMYSFEHITSINLYENFIELGEEEYGEYTELLWDKSLDLSDCEFIECTGLEDCNGVEIYEGDILNIKLPGIKAFNSKVIRGLGMFIMQPHVFVLKDVAGLSKKVGNMYENPELI